MGKLYPGRRKVVRLRIHVMGHLMYAPGSQASNFPLILKRRRNKWKLPRERHRLKKGLEWGLRQLLSHRLMHALGFLQGANLEIRRTKGSSCLALSLTVHHIKYQDRGGVQDSDRRGARGGGWGQRRKPDQISFSRNHNTQR